LDIACGWLHSTIIIKSDKCTENNQQDPLGYFTLLPNEIIFIIMHYLGPLDLCRLAKTSSALKHLADSDEFWQNLFRTKYPNLTFIEEQLKNIVSTSSWKAVFIEKTRYEKPYIPKTTMISNDKLSAIWAWFKPKFSTFNSKRLVMVGLDAAGKTSLLYKLKIGDVITTIPRIGFNLETIETKQVTIYNWDIGGADKILSLFRFFYEICSGLIFVVDSNDRDRF